MPDRKHMRPRQIDHMNIVADAGAIRRLIIVAIDFQIIRHARRSQHGARYQMGFGIVLFAQFAIETAPQALK